MRRLCQTLKVHPSDFYAWLAEPQSTRANEDQRLGLIKHAWLESGGVCGYRKIHDDLCELGETCGRNRVARLMHAEGLRSQTGHRRHPGFHGGKPTIASPNHLARQYKVSEPVSRKPGAIQPWAWLTLSCESATGPSNAVSIDTLGNLKSCDTFPLPPYSQRLIKPFL